jgi:hypothetical protein
MHELRTWVPNGSVFEYFEAGELVFVLGGFGIVFDDGLEAVVGAGVDFFGGGGIGLAEGGEGFLRVSRSGGP